MSTFTTDKNFNSMSGSVTVLLFVVFVEEFVVVVAFEATGLSLSQLAMGHAYEGAPLVEEVDEAQYPAPPARYPALPAPYQSKGLGAGNTALNIAKKTIIGRIAMRFIDTDSDIPMQYDSYRRGRGRGYR